MLARGTQVLERPRRHAGAHHTDARHQFESPRDHDPARSGHISCRAASRPRQLQRGVTPRNSMDSSRITVPDHLPAPMAASQLIWRALGPLRRDGSELSSTGSAWPGNRRTSARSSRPPSHSEPTLRAWTVTVEHVGRDLVLPTRLHHDLTRPSRPGEDHRSRGRQAQRLGLPKPAAARQSEVLSARERGQAVATRRILAALGPLDLTEITAALERRQRRHTHHSLRPTCRTCCGAPLSPPAGRTACTGSPTLPNPQPWTRRCSPRPRAAAPPFTPIDRSMTCFTEPVSPADKRPPGPTTPC